MMARPSLALAALLLLLSGCDRPAPVQAGLSFRLDRQVPEGETVLAPMLHQEQRTMVAPEAPEAPATIVAPSSAARPSAGGPAPAAPLALTDRLVELPGGTAVAVPEGLSGRVTFFSPDAVPATLDLVPELALLHPRAVALPAPPSAKATIDGRVAAAGAQLSYFAPGRSAAPATQADAEGRFSLTVPIGGPETGVLLARSGSAIGAVSVPLAPEAAVSLDPIALAAPIAHDAPMPAPPAGLALASASLLAVDLSAATPWRVPLHVSMPARVPPVYALPGFAMVHAYSAEASDRMRGSTTSGTPGQVPAFMAAPELGAMPSTLQTGTRLSWPAVAGADLYTLKLTSSGSTAPLWEAALTRPEVTIPERVALTGERLVLQVEAWDAPDVTIYSVASARQLRVPASPGGQEGRRSWARRVFGPEGK